MDKDPENQHDEIESLPEMNHQGREVDLELEWIRRMISASKAVKGRVQDQLQYADRLYAKGFAASAIVSAWTAFEVYSGEVIVRSILAAFIWPFDELGDHLFSSIFGQNGKLERLRKLLMKTQAFGAFSRADLDNPAQAEIVADPFSEALWQRLQRTRDIRNDIVHAGVQVSQEEARTALDSVINAIGEVEKYLEPWSPYV